MLSFVEAPRREVDISRETWQEEEDDEMEMTVTIYGEDSIREVIDFLEQRLIPYHRD